MLNYKAMTHMNKEKKNLIYEDLAKALKSPNLKGQNETRSDDIQLLKIMCEN